MRKDVLHLYPNITIFQVYGKTFDIYLTYDEIALGEFQLIGKYLRNIKNWNFKFHFLLNSLIYCYLGQC